MKIAVIGTGYVGLSNAILLAQHHEVVTVDIIEEKINLINEHKSPIRDKKIEEFLAHKHLNLRATNNLADAVIDATYVIVATPTDYDTHTHYFNTSSVDSVLKNVNIINPSAIVIIKSTIPVGYIKSKREEGFNNLIFVPEFLREGMALYDNLYPSRIVIGEHSERAKRFAMILIEGAEKKDIPVLYTNATEAEAIKLFSNTYLAMRVAFFNELDGYAWTEGLNTREIIEGVTLDPRIGNNYCNPSFGYGGYCLPKDTKQLLANYNKIPQNLISAIVLSNRTRKDIVTDMTLKRKPKCVGIYRLTMKSESDNFRSSAIFGVIKRLRNNNVKVVVYEPILNSPIYYDIPIIKDLRQFCDVSDVILANRWNSELDEVKSKVITRDIFNKN